MRYFFDVFMDGRLIPDNEGKELETVEVVQQVAVQRALELKHEHPRDGAMAIGNVIEVNREDGKRVFALPIYQHQCCRDTVP
jgi:hypothetical protein